MYSALSTATGLNILTYIIFKRYFFQQFIVNNNFEKWLWEFTRDKSEDFKTDSFTYMKQSRGRNVYLRSLVVQNVPVFRNVVLVQI